MKILITGCGNSGTTLIKRLFMAFEGASWIEKQVKLDNFCTLPDNGLIIGKRTPDVLYSGNMPYQLANHQLELIKKHDIKVVNIIRDGRDAIMTTRPINFTPERWIRAVDQYFNYGDAISVDLRYEKLVREPDRVQQHIMDILDLTPACDFSDYPAFWNAAGGSENDPMSFRAISSISVGKDPNYYKKVCSGSVLKRFEYNLRRLGYV